MRKKVFLILGFVLFILVVFFPQIRLGTITVLFLRDILDERTVHQPDRGTLAWITPTPVVERFLISGGEQQIPADLYRVPDSKRRAAILLTHGIIESGKDDPRLIRFARSLARSGFVVLVPELRGMKSFRIRFGDVDDIVASVRFLAAKKEIVDEGKMGLVGFSYGAGPTFMAAAHPSISRQVKFMLSFGGYYDPINVIRFITTGHYEYRGEKGFLKPEPYGKFVFFMNNVDYVQNERDRELLREIFKQEETKKGDDLLPLIGRLTPSGRYLYELLTNDDPHRVDELVKRIDPRVRDYLKRLAVAPLVPKIQAYLLIGHGSTDPLIPYTESLRLADAVQDPSRVHLVILKLFSHVDPAAKNFSVKEFFTGYLPSMAQFYYLIYDLLSQQR
jgi:dienelactone hydrolase